MATNNMAEGVGKRIVDALKQQSDMEIQNVVENSEETSTDSFNDNSFDELEYSYTEEAPKEPEIIPEQPVYSEPAYTNHMMFTQPQPVQEELDDFEIPNNIAVLKQLISQLPAGVSKQTGAQIIKQTMEALGISMKSVLQEAQQVQENLNNSTRECQASIVEHKKQISMLERQTQKFQRQYNSLNDVISLFVQTNI